MPRPIDQSKHVPLDERDEYARNARELLPSVSVRLVSGKVIPNCVTKGRNNLLFGTVVLPSGAHFEAAWSTIGYCAKHDIPVRM